MSADAATTTPARTTGTAAARRTRVIGSLLLALGVLLAVAGIGTWGGIAAGLVQERVTVSDNAAMFAGQSITSPWTAWAQSEVIRTDIADMTGGRTYAEMDREDPQRAAVATGTCLRASLITSVVAFGVALALVGIGVGFVLGGLGLRSAAAHVPAA